VETVTDPNHPLITDENANKFGRSAQKRAEGDALNTDGGGDDDNKALLSKGNALLDSESLYSTSKKRGMGFAKAKNKSSSIPGQGQKKKE